MHWNAFGVIQTNMIGCKTDHTPLVPSSPNLHFPRLLYVARINMLRTSRSEKRDAFPSKFVFFLPPVRFYVKRISK